MEWLNENEQSSLEPQPRFCILRFCFDNENGGPCFGNACARKFCVYNNG